MKYIELFAGIGGFRYGLEKANDDMELWGFRQKEENLKTNSANIVSKSNKRQFAYTCVYANEIDKYACQIYRKNYGGKELYEGDIREISAESIPDHDLLVGGFPCQAFSIAGKRKGFADTRGTLFFEICRIAKVKQPRLLLLENVKGLLNHEGGATFRTILLSLSELGYDCEWEVLNSKNFGVPQNRERVFIVGHLRGTGGGQVFPIGGTMRESNEGSEGETSGCVKAGEGSIQNDNTYLIHDKRQCGEVRIYKNTSPSVTTTWGTGGGNIPYTKIKKHQQDFIHNKNGILRTLLGGTHGNTQHFTKTLINNQIRRLTPTECERLQGFPDGWTEKGITPEGKCVTISDTQRYKCLGNAVTTNVITEIGKKLF